MVQRRLDALADFLRLRGALRVAAGLIVRHGLEELRFALFALRHRDFFVRLLPAQMVKANVHYHPVQPGGKLGVGAELANGAVDLQKRLLVKIPRFFR